MLQVEEGPLTLAMTETTMGGGAIEMYKKPLEKAQAETARNSLVMQLYSLVFDWCTDMINAAIAVNNAEACIGILDIFGLCVHTGCQSMPPSPLATLATCLSIPLRGGSVRISPSAQREL